MGVRGGRAARRLDPWRRVAALATGSAAVLLLLGPLYIAACGESLRAGYTPTLCMLGWTFEGLVVLPVAGLLAGVVGRGLVDWLLLLAGAVLGAIVGGLLAGDADRLVNPAMQVMVALSLGYGIGLLARRLRRRAPGDPESRSAGRAPIAIALAMTAVAVTSAVVVAQMPRGWQRPLGGLGPAPQGVGVTAGRARSTGTTRAPSGRSRATGPTLPRAERL